MCRVVSRRYPAAAGSAVDARRFARRSLSRWELELNAVSDAVLLTSELVTNAVLHAASPVGLTLAVAEGVLEVGVSDDDPRPPRRRIPEPPGQYLWPPTPAGGADTYDRGPEPDRTPGFSLLPAELAREGGRGLLLVDALADEWGVTSLAAGKQVWFRLAAGQEWPYRTGCRCGGEDLSRVRLESGRHVLAITGPWDDPDPDPDPDSHPVPM